MTKGQKAPNFTLPDTDKNMVSLADYKGKNVVLLFFPMAFSSACTFELCKVRDEFHEYEQLDAEVLGISVDSPFTLARFKEKERLNYRLLSDFNKEASRAYDAIYEEFVLGLKGVSKRSAFIIDKEGVVQYAEVLEDAGTLPAFDNIQFTLNELN